jgi:two-component system OmpR family response regulator
MPGQQSGSGDGKDQAARVLVVEDEDSIRDLVSTALRFTRYAVDNSSSGLDALRRIETDHLDLVILDVNLPDMDGFTVCRKARAEGLATPVIFLTARDDPADLRTGFMGGGDDYLTKPFSLDELVLRIRAVLRRTRQQHEDSDQARLTCGDVVLDEQAYLVWRSDDEISLSPTEFRLLRFLMRNPNRVMTRAQVIDHVWDYDFAGDPATVETYISYLRRKLGDRDGTLIRTVRGVGYALQDPSRERRGGGK